MHQSAAESRAISTRSEMQLSAKTEPTGGGHTRRGRSPDYATSLPKGNFPPKIVGRRPRRKTNSFEDDSYQAKLASVVQFRGWFNRLAAWGLHIALVPATTPTRSVSEASGHSRLPSRLRYLRDLLFKSRFHIAPPLCWPALSSASSHSILSSTPNFKYVCDSTPRFAELASVVKFPVTPVRPRPPLPTAHCQLTNPSSFSIFVRKSSAISPPDSRPRSAGWASLAKWIRFHTPSAENRICECERKLAHRRLHT
jgi:hypothetical protein